MQKVAFLIHNQHETGPYPKVLELAAAVASAGADVTVICTARHARLHQAESIESGVRIVESPDLFSGALRQGADPWNSWRRAWWLIRHRPDVVHAIDCRPVVILPALVARMLGAKLVISWWDLFGRGGTIATRSSGLYRHTAGVVEAFFERFFRRFADSATVISRQLQTELEALGYPSEKILLQRLGCDTKRFVPVGQREARLALGLPENGDILCYVGAIFPDDLTILVDSIRRLRCMGRREVRTILVGTPPVDERIAHELDIVHVPRQPLEAVFTYLCAADLCLLPAAGSVANMARWPSKVGDYLNAGRPVVSTPVGDLPALFAKFRLGFMAASATVECFTAALEEAFSNRSEWAAIGSNCRHFAESELDVSLLGRELVSLYAAISPSALAHA